MTFLYLISPRQNVTERRKERGNRRDTKSDSRQQDKKGKLGGRGTEACCVKLEKRCEESQKIQ